MPPAAALPPPPPKAFCHNTLSPKNKKNKNEQDACNEPKNVQRLESISDILARKAAAEFKGSGVGGGMRGSGSPTKGSSGVGFRAVGSPIKGGGIGLKGVASPVKSGGGGTKGVASPKKGGGGRRGKGVDGGIVIGGGRNARSLKAIQLLMQELARD